MTAGRSEWGKRVLGRKRPDTESFRFLAAHKSKAAVPRRLRELRRRQRQRRLWALKLAGTVAVIGLLVALGFRLVLLVRGQATASPGSVGGLITSSAQGTNIALAKGNQPAHGQTINGMPCYPDEVTLFHIHTTLHIYAAGQEKTLPVGLGFVEPKSSGTPGLGYAGSTQCIYQIHTHYADNQIHVEAPFRVKYTLGDVFALWGEPLSRTQVAGYQKDAIHPLAFQVSDSQTNAVRLYTGDPQAIPLVDGETIVILYDSVAVQR